MELIVTCKRPSQCAQKLMGRPIHLKKETAYEGKPIVQLFNRTIVRNLVIPSEGRSIYPAVWHQSEMERIKKDARCITASERLAARDAAKNEKERLIQESEDRKNELRLRLEKPKKGPKMREIDSVASRRQNHLLKRAYELRQEQEQDIKEVNKMIMATKCHAIRDAQVAEKELIAREAVQEEARLTRMIQQDLQKGLLEEEEKLREKEQKKKLFIASLNEQLKELELERLLEAERLDEEGRANRRLMIKLEEEEVANQEQKILNQLRTREDLRRATDEVERFKAMSAEENRISEMRLMEYQRIKNEKEQQIAEEKAAIKAAKARECLRLQNKMGDALKMQELQDELNAQRIQEEVEREYRKKQKREAQKHLEVLRNNEENRIAQIENLQKRQAIAAARAEQEFLGSLKIMKEQKAKDEEMERIRIAERNKYRESLICQINENEKIRRENRAKELTAGQVAKLEEESRRRQVVETVKHKLKKITTLQPKYKDELVLKVTEKLKRLS